MYGNFTLLKTGFQGHQEFLFFDFSYFLIISLISLLIFLKLKKVYSLTNHEGIARFKGVFFYFSITYLLILVHFFVFKSKSLLPVNVSFIYRHLNMFFISYLSTMAVLLILMIMLKLVNNHRLRLISHLTSFIVSLIAFFFSYPELIIIIQLIILLLSFIIIRRRASYLSKQNLITYLTLLFLWFFNLFFINRLIIIWFKIPLYITTICLFLSIYLRVNKRLS